MLVGWFSCLVGGLVPMPMSRPMPMPTPQPMSTPMPMAMPMSMKPVVIHTLLINVLRVIYYLLVINHDLIFAVHCLLKLADLLVCCFNCLVGWLVPMSMPMVMPRPMPRPRPAPYCLFFIH